MDAPPGSIPDPQQEIKHVSDTAFWIAYLRAVETRRPDALFQDPLAAKLAGERGRKISMDMPASRVTGWIVVLRTLIIDEFIATAIREGVDTVLNLGAGLDTRPYRLKGLPASVRWIEVDYPEMMAFKEKELADERPQVALTRVGLDLSQAAERRDFFSSVAETSKKVFVLTEGVVPYLSNEDAGSLAQDLRSYPNFAYWLLDYVSAEAQVHRSRKRMNEKLVNSPFLFAPANWFQFFEDHGWKEQQTQYYWELSRKVGRSMPFPFVFQMLMGLRSLFMSKRRKDQWRKAAGYGLLVQK